MGDAGDQTSERQPDREPTFSENTPGEAPDIQDIYLCPHCGESIEINLESNDHLPPCPHCGEQFTIPNANSFAVEIDPEEAEDASRENELDGMRIRQLSTLRRAAIRGRTYLQIGWVVCGTGGVQLTLKAMQRVRYEHVWDARTFAFSIFSVVSFMLSIFFLRRAVELGRELKRPLLDEPTAPPDFSTLSDGSQHARHLEDMQ